MSPRSDIPVNLYHFFKQYAGSELNFYQLELALPNRERLQEIRMKRFPKVHSFFLTTDGSSPNLGQLKTFI